MWRREQHAPGADATITPQTGACCDDGWSRGGAAPVSVTTKLAGGLGLRALPLVLAAALCGCTEFDSSGAWFAKPLNLYGPNLGYTYEQFDEAKRDHPITANDLVQANGACPRHVTPAQPPPVGAAPDAADSGVADAAALIGGGIAIGMSECDIVARLGQPTAVNIGAKSGRPPGGGADFPKRPKARCLSVCQRPAH